MAIHQSHWEEIGSRLNTVYGEYFLLISNPANTDTDGDRVDDYEELKIWESETTAKDSDGDGFDDGEDPRINTEDVPASVLDIQSDNYKKYVEFSVADNSQVTVAANPYYKPDYPLHSPYWNSSKAKVIQLSDSEYRVEFDEHGDLHEPPEKYWINITDSHGNARAVLIDAREGVAGDIVKGGTAVAAVTVADPLPLDEVAGVLIFAAVTVGGGFVVNEYFAAGNADVVNRPVTETVAEYAPKDTALDFIVRLPGGAVASDYDPRIDDTIHRGHGWEYIDITLPGVTSEEIGDVLRAPTIVDDAGVGKIVVSDHPSNEHQLILWLVDGMVVKAYSGQYIEDPLGRRIIIDRNDRHPVIGKDTNYDEVEQVITNPDQIWDGGRMDHYVKEINGKWVIVRVYKHLAGWEVSTATVHSSKQKARDYLKDESDLNGRIYGPDWTEL